MFSPEKHGARKREQDIAQEIHPNPAALTQGALKLMARNTNQIFGDNLSTPVDFVVFYAKEGKGIRPEGGTGQAVEMARLKGIPTINMASANWRDQLNDVLSKKATTQPAPKAISYVVKPIKEFKVGDQVQDNKYNVWKIISQAEYEKESKIGTKAGVKARFITNVHPNEARKANVLNPNSTTHIKPNSVNTLGENTVVQSTQPISNKDVVNALNKNNTIDKKCNS